MRGIDRILAENRPAARRIAGIPATLAAPAPAPSVDPLCAESWMRTDQTAAAPGGTPGGKGAPDISVTWQPNGVVCAGGDTP